MTYRAKAITQRDGSPLQNSNCLMAAAAVGLDYHTLGGKTSTGKQMRAYSGDLSGGTNTDEIERAWQRGYEEDPVTRDGQPWAKVLEDLAAGRLVMLQVWAATVGSQLCLSGTGQYGHGICVAPEPRTFEGTKQWLVADPWCKPARWKWVDESRLRAGADRWANKISAEGGNRPLSDIPYKELLAIVRYLFSLYTPDNPAHDDEDDDVGGPANGVLFASTKAQQEDTGDMSINTNGSGITSKRRVKLTADAGFYADADLTEKYGTLDAGTVRTLMGPVVGGKAHAILVNTSKPYNDGTDRPTICYVTKDKCGEPYVVEDTAIADRDKAWRAWLNGDGDAPDK
jgi:hypothetical protein